MINMSTLTIKHKIDLFNKLYKEISGHGINGDTELAHVNKYEAAVLRAMGGSGTVNPVTGLREYWGDDDPAPAPAPAATTTVKQVSDLPEYFKPYVEELFATAQDVYEKPYVPYGHQLVKGEDGSYTTEAIEDFDTSRLAPLTKEQQAAFGGLRDMFTTLDEETGQRTFKDPTAEGFTEAGRLATRGARGFDELGQVDPETGEVIKTAGEVFQETYMSPYKQAVTDIQIKEAEKLQEQARQKRQGAARLANALGHGRYGMQEAIAGQLGEETLDKIRKKGLQEAWTAGLDIFQKDRAAASKGAMDRARLTGDELSTGLKSLGALQTTGEVQRALDQQKKDLSYEEFVRQQQFPKQNLQELSGILRGFQVQPTTYQTSQQYKPPMSLGQQLMAAGTLGAGISKGLGKSLLSAKGGSVNAAGGGLLALANGGTSEVTEVEEEFIPRDLSKLGGLQAQALKIIQYQKGYDKYGNPLRPEDVDMDSPEAVEKRRKAIEGKYPSHGEQLENWQRTLEAYKRNPPSSMPEIIGKRQAEAMVEAITKPKDLLPIPEGADDELTETEFWEQKQRSDDNIPTTGSDSGWDIEKIMAGFGEGFDEAAPYLASYAQQQGWTDTAEGLKGISEAALKKAQKDYYAGLGTKAKAWKAVERLKTDRALTEAAIKTELKTIELRLKDLQTKEGFLGLSDEEKIERDMLTRSLEEVRIRFGAFPSSASMPSGRVARET
jgi:hypothetical protein